VGPNIASWLVTRSADVALLSIEEVVAPDPLTSERSGSDEDGLSIE
jgi:hypothetical protein